MDFGSISSTAHLRRLYRLRTNRFSSPGSRVFSDTVSDPLTGFLSKYKNIIDTKGKDEEEILNPLFDFSFKTFLVRNLPTVESGEEYTSPSPWLVSLPPVKDEISDEVVQIVDEAKNYILDFEDNWDGEGSPPYKEETIDAAASFLYDLKRLEATRVQICAASIRGRPSRGGWKRGHRGDAEQQCAGSTRRHLGCRHAGAR